MIPKPALAARIRDLRKRHGWSGQKLAEEMTAAGVPWDRSIVANLETGRREAVSVQELLALAYVLDVSPVHLIVPPDAPADQPYLPVPNVRAHAGTVRAWIAGQRPLAGQDPRYWHVERPAAEWQPPQVAQDVAEVEGRLAEHVRRLADERGSGITWQDQPPSEIDRQRRERDDGER